MTITAAKYVSKDGYRIEYQVDGGPDWIHIKGFDHPDRAAVLAAIPSPEAHVPTVIVPEAITKLQFLKQLRAQGQFATIKLWAMGLAEDSDIRIEWEHLSVITKETALIDGLKSQFGFTDQQVDNFFVAAGSIQ